MSSAPRAARKWLGRLWKTTLAVGCLIGLIGFAHTKAGRPLLHLLANTAGCPVDFEGGDPKAVEAFRVDHLLRQEGTAAALSHPALGFELGQSTRADVERWLGSVNARCESTRHDSVLSCDLPARERQPGIDDLHLQFDAENRLVALDLFRPEACSSDAIGHLKQLQRELSRRVGPVTGHAGKLSSSYLESPYRRTAFEYNYKHYVARVSATNLAARGVRIREQYQWAPDASS
ncbi:MAG TPA: hypothetical protein VHM70_30280 [Polyangiaceae bacterium]|jgi:hypothetical protein|nr:hypothetical protein [Polyangiaceae bacterium]